MRRGFSLIELLVVMSGASVIFSVLAISLYALGRTQRTVQNESHAAAALHDFARQLREDAHGAAEAVAAGAEDGGENAIATLTLHRAAGPSVVYDFNPDQATIRRRLREGDQTTARDGFVLPPGSRVEFHTPDVESSLLAVRVFRPEGASAAPGWRITRIEAAIGLHQEHQP